MKTAAMALSALLLFGSLSDKPMVPNSARAGEPTVWGIWTTEMYDGKVGEPRPSTGKKNSFPTYAQCMKEIETQIDSIERKGYVKRIGKYETQLLLPFPSGDQGKYTQLWECRELPKATGELWAIWTTQIHEGKAVDAQPLTGQDDSFPTHAQCVKGIETQIDFMERAGYMKRIGKYETRWLTPLPFGAQDKLTQRWECRELPQDK